MRKELKNFCSQTFWKRMTPAGSELCNTVLTHRVEESDESTFGGIFCKNRDNVIWIQTNIS